MRTIVLASTSKRRKEIFSLLGIPFVVSAPNYDEDNNLKMSPTNLVKRLSYEKANSLVDSFKSAIIIGSDTLVINKGAVLPKPKSEDEAVDMLMSLSDTTHSILTGYAIVDAISGKNSMGARETQVTFRKISRDEAKSYIKKEDVLDVAGAYDHEHLGSIFVINLNGDYFSSIGLPLYNIALLLKNNYSIDVLKYHVKK
ncbi:MAG: Maf family nucleotide pyrophosphatase [bacterium]|nr:Maf family nucleotide pyrophosphatase [bacterium]